ncbi:MAG: hypothetical protein V3T30_07505, partial [Thermodesulfobacteriota bacterium]
PITEQRRKMAKGSKRGRGRGKGAIGKESARGRANKAEVSDTAEGEEELGPAVKHIDVIV